MAFVYSHIRLDKNEYFKKITKKEISENLGKFRIGNKNGVQFKVININNGIIYDNLTFACLIYNYNTEYMRIKKNRKNKNFEIYHDKKLLTNVIT